MATLRNRRVTLAPGKFAQIKIIDNTAPIRLSVISGTVDVEHFHGEKQLVDIATAVGTGDYVYTATANASSAWGSEVRIVTAAGAVIEISYMG